MKAETKRALKTNGEDLWAHHKVTCFDNGDGTPYMLQFVQPYEPAELNRLVSDHQAQMETCGGKPFPLSDIEQRRIAFVGLRNISRYVNVIECRPISWAQIMLLGKPEVRRQIPNTEYARCIGTSVLVETRDECFLVACRSKNVATHQGKLHVSAAGYTDYNGVEAARSCLVQAYRELEEEVGLLPGEIKRISHLGIVKSAEHECASVEVCFLAEVDMPSDAVLDRAKGAKDSWEGKHAAHDGQSAVNLLENQQFAPTGAGCLLLALGL